MTDVQVPKLNSNDDAYLLVSWLADDGAAVSAGTAIAEVETSKAIDEIVAGADGTLRHQVRVGARVVPGQVVATVGAGSVPHLPSPTSASDAERDGLLITAPARARMAELGVTREQVGGLGLAVVRSTDVDNLARHDHVEGSAGMPRAGSRQPLPKRQCAVGRVVARSHATIPAAYAAVRIDVTDALRRAREMIRDVRRPVGLTELVIAAVAGLHERFPLFYGHLDDNGDTVLFSDAPHVGITIDLGEGLFVPVIRDAAHQSVAIIAHQLMEFRLAAAEGAFRAADLEGANISVTLHTDADVVLAIPLVFPGQACAIAVTTPTPEVWLDTKHQPHTRTICQIGLAYDHRLINGRDAALFLRAVKEALA